MHASQVYSSYSSLTFKARREQVRKEPDTFFTQSPSSEKLPLYWQVTSCPKMCLIRFRSDREVDVIVPNRPARVELPPSRAGQAAQSLAVSSAHGQQPSLTERHSRERARPQAKAVVIQQIAPETSRIALRDGSSYSYEDGPVLTTTKRAPLPERSDFNKTSLRPRKVPRPDSLAPAKDPRQSVASYRSTRERIVVIDDLGRRREYYRRHDSGR